MKNLLSFDEYLNESVLNEAFSGPAKANIKKISDITRGFLEKSLPNLLSKYDCTVSQSTINKETYIIEHPMQKSLFDIYLSKMNRNRFAIILMYAYVDIFKGPRDHAKKVPFIVGTQSEFTKYSTDLVYKTMSNWQYAADSEDDTFLTDPNLISQYQDMVDNWLEGIEKNLEYYIKNKVIKN